MTTRSELKSFFTLALTALVSTGAADAVFIVATDGSLGAGNYAYTGADGDSASGPSAVSAGALPSTTDVPPTFFSLNAIFGGNGSSDEYTFSYSPSVDADNIFFSAGTLYNSLTASLTDNLTATGLVGGGGGIYNVYRLHPATTNVSGGNTTYQVSVNGGLELTEVINQNEGDLSTGENIGRWELIGSVPLSSASDSVTVTMFPETSSFVSMRSSGIMFEYAGPIPEPSSSALLGLSLLALLRRRRR